MIIINTINPHSYCIALDDPIFRKSLFDSDILLPDGIGFVYASKLLNKKKINKVSGYDLHQYLIKIANKNIAEIWKTISYLLTGETLTDNEKFLTTINGITVSPKKSFCILKIWTSTLDFQNVNVLNKIENVSFQGCLFKKHKP